MGRTKQTTQTIKRPYNRSQIAAISSFIQMLQDIDFFTPTQLNKLQPVLEQMQPVVSAQLNDLKTQANDATTRRSKLEKAMELNKQLNISNSQLVEQLKEANETIATLKLEIKELKANIKVLESKLLAQQTIVITKQIKKKGFSTEYDQSIADLKHEGYSIRAIATELGISKSYVQGRIKALAL